MVSDYFRLIYEGNRRRTHKAQPKQWKLVRDRSEVPLLVRGRKLALPAMLVNEMIVAKDEEKIRFWCSIYQNTVWQSEEDRRYLLFSSTRIRIKGGVSGKRK